jgi:threonine/homoserine/homoserine lactone efflux protein
MPDMADTLLRFVGVSALVIMTPGQDTALTVRNTLLGNRRAGISTVLGVVTGQAVWAIATGAGVAAILVASERAFLALKLAGAAYLVFLGGKTLVGAVRRGENRSVSTARGSGQRMVPRLAYQQGVVSNLGNPKMAIFFLSLLPQFTVQGNSSVLALLLGILFCALTLFWLACYAFVVARAGNVLRRPRVRRVLDGLIGAVLLGLGLRLAAEHR